MSSAAGAWLLAAVLLAAARGQGLVPAQPIAFPHKIHAGDNKLNCLYCHSGARRSSVAGIPSVQMCMGCHKLVAPTRPEIVKLRGYFDRGEPIRWTKVVKVADFVFFNHFPHIDRGVECQQCHGPVQTMMATRLDHPLNMDVCIACHRQWKASLDCYTCHR